MVVTMWKRIALALVAVTLGVGDAVETQPAASVPGQWTKPMPFGDTPFLAAAPEPACDWRGEPSVDVPVEREPQSIDADVLVKRLQTMSDHESRDVVLHWLEACETQAFSLTLKYTDAGALAGSPKHLKELIEGVAASPLAASIASAVKVGS